MSVNKTRYIKVKKNEKRLSRRSIQGKRVLNILGRRVFSRRDQKSDEGIRNGLSKNHIVVI